MEGMEQKYDGHCWIRPVTTSMSFPAAAVRRSKCAGHLVCVNSICPIKAFSGQANETAWRGKLTSSIDACGMTSLAAGTLTCFHCGDPATLLRECQCVVY